MRDVINLTTNGNDNPRHPAHPASEGSREWRRQRQLGNKKVRRNGHNLNAGVTIGFMSGPILEIWSQSRSQRSQTNFQPPSCPGSRGVWTGLVFKKDKDRRKRFTSFLFRDKYSFQTVKKMYIVFAAIT
jgi:hypothetical protein